MKGMTMKRTLLASLLAAFCAPGAFALPPAPSDPDGNAALLPRVYLAAMEDAHAQAEAWRRWSEDFTREMRGSMGTLFGNRMDSAKVVKEAPYSAELVTETNQPLADGNVISRKTSGRVYRDREGRTRQESDTQGHDASVFISDPVAGRTIVLKPAANRATVLPRIPASARSETRSRQVVRQDDTEVRIEDGRVFINGREIADGNAVVKSKSGKEVKVENGRITIDGKEVGSGDGSGTHVGISREVIDGVPREEVRVQVVRIGEDAFQSARSVPPIPPIPPVPPPPVTSSTPVAPLPPVPPMPGISTLRFESTARLGKGTTTSLGTKEFDGVKAEGKSTVWTIPAGEIGNRNAINVTSESWYSPELQVTVYSRYNDPRTGESIYRLAGIKRAEPPADLFKVPEGYSLKGRDRRGAAPEAKAPSPPG
jgi:hypothetical protein